jgi:protein-tyrosine phosphatase
MSPGHCFDFMKRSIRKAILACLLCAGVAFSIHADSQKTNLPPKRQVLFICTGNYYRSRFAEALFNQKAAEAHLEWKAVSRGLKLFPSQRGISSLARRELIKRGVPKELCQGDPKALAKEDLEQSDYVVLMDEAEHRPMMENQFPMRDHNRNHYWHIPEAEEMSPSKVSQAMSTNIEELIRTLGR